MAKQDYEGVKTIKIAPSADEIRREGNVFLTEFNGMAIKWVLPPDYADMDDEDEQTLKDWLSTAIAMSGKMWQVPYQLNQHLPFKSEVYVNGERVEYPK